MAFVNFLSNFTNSLFRHFVCFEKFHSPVSELIHLARCVKFNPYFISGIVLIVFCGTQSNRRTNFIPRLARFNPRLALIVFSGTGAWCATSTPSGDGALIRAKFESFLSHIVKAHSNFANPIFNKCAHGEAITDRKWFEEGMQIKSFILVLLSNSI